MPAPISEAAPIQPDDLGLDHGTPCPTCRDYVIGIRRLAADIRNTKPFAHAHHAIIGRTRGAIADLTALRTRYRRHKGGHVTSTGDTEFQRLNRALAEHLTDHANGDAA